ncbi:MAG: hypothetical protein E7293_03280 [Lachnospiraceae bacterium]|nr:hypothetical protein [Lachnospiraceae bacterium]
MKRSRYSPNWKGAEAMRAKRPQTIIAEQTREMLFDYIKFFIQYNGYAPTLKEVSEASGLHTATVYNHVQKLIESGRLETDWSKSARRNLHLPGRKEE